MHRGLRGVGDLRRAGRKTQDGSRLLEKGEITTELERTARYNSAGRWGVEHRGGLGKSIGVSAG